MRGALLVVAFAVAVGALVPAAAHGSTSPLTDTRKIRKLASDAYIWGIAPEFVYRFLHYNALATAPVNTFAGGDAEAAWNNAGTNAGDASVIYLNAFLDLSGKKPAGAKELVLTVPRSTNDYYIADMLDSFINTVGSVGTRTTSSEHPQTYLLVGPTSPYAHKRVVRIDGFTYRVMVFDTNLGWMNIRIRADSLAPPADPTSVNVIRKTVVERFALNTLADFEARAHRPKYFKPGQYTPTTEQLTRATKWGTAPTNAVLFYKQVGQSLKASPIPTARTGLNGIRLSTLPRWVVPQVGATTRYLNPAFGQKAALALFGPIGLTANGFRVPSNWGPRQIAALKAGYATGRAKVNKLVNLSHVSSTTNYWFYLNSGIGTYPNTPGGYLQRALIVLSGAAANIPQDAVYAQTNNLDGTATTQLDGNNTYTLTFMPPVTDPPALPVDGSVPPTVNNNQGNPRGFWSVTVYQPDTSESSAPFITQASVQNTAYSTANIAVTAVDPSSDMVTVKPSTWGPLELSTPILFGPTAAQYGLMPGQPYYVASTPIEAINPMTKAKTYSFKVSAMWQQALSPNDVPIQGDQADSGSPGTPVDLTNPGGTVELQWGPIQPVSQLGSQQLTSGKLVRNQDQSVTIWIAPTLPPNAFPTNWIPTPSTKYYESVYGTCVPGQCLPTTIRPMIRIYYPAPGSNTEASILPPPNGLMRSTYQFPALQQLG